ncbi:MAG TPA: type II secretion system minor pseudopilin GspI [Gammaproteobacteria bacterium]|nr:type II secretion system minor pseudopilin GspI [Gammaproteobacteria bacterium]
MGNRGFTLLEVLVALTVLGISFMAVLGTAGQAISSSAHLRDKTFAHWVGMNVIAEQRISGVWPDTGTSDGEVQMANREWTWEMEVSETAAEHLRRIEVRVFFEDKPDDALALVTGFIGEPQILMGLPGNRNRNGENGEGREPPPGSLEPGSDTPPDKDP